MFKKRGKRRRQNFRQASQDLGDDEPLGRTVEGIKFLQKFRGKKRGIKAGIEDEDQDEENEEITTEEPTAHFLGAYQQGMAVKEDEKDAKLMKIYIEEEVRKRKKQKLDEDSRTDSQQDEASAGKKKVLDETEEYLKKINEEGRITEQRGSQSWSAGITEISLPISVKLRNIEETEKAKQKMLGKKGTQEEADKKKKKKNSEKDPRNSNYSSNFNQHQRAYVQRMRESREMRAGPEKPAEKKPVKGEKVPYSTDDRVVARFIKRNRYRR